MHHVPSVIIVAMIGMLAGVISPPPSFADIPTIQVTGPVTSVSGNTVVQPPKVDYVQFGPGFYEPGEGPGNTHNWCAYNLPGQASEPDCLSTDPGFGQKYDIAYLGPRMQPVQSSDWWVSLGMQWQGWVTGLDPNNPVPTTPGIISEPILARFVDLPDQQKVSGLDLPVQGLSLWNQNDMIAYTGTVADINGKPHFVSDNPATYGIVRGNIADPRTPIVTVGLAGAHPLGTFSDLQNRTAPPWTNVRVLHYSDWGVDFVYTDQGNQLQFTMANGSPFVWAERTQGSAPFRVWAGVTAGNVASSGELGGLQVWHNQNGVLGLTVKVAWVPILPPFKPDNYQVDCPHDYITQGPLEGMCNAPRVAATASYVVYADQGAWTEQKSTDPNSSMSLFANAQATKLVVLAMPHNVDPNNPAALTAALQDFQAYAWQRIDDTRINYPPISGSKASVTVGGVSKPLGYDQANATIRSLMEVATENFATGGPGGNTMQLVFPHQRKSMVSEDLQNIPQENGAPKYTWRSLKGELQAYPGNSYVRELRTLGVLPFLPSLAVNGTPAAAASNIYDSLKLWFFGQITSPAPGAYSRTGEPQPAPNATAAFAGAGGIGTHAPGANNSYLPNTAALTEGLIIADQLSRSSNLNTPDPTWGSPPVNQPVGGPVQQPFPPEKTVPAPDKTKAAVAGEIRNYVLQTLKEVFGKWADIYTGQWFQYNPDFNTTYGFPEGYKAVQTLSDHHFHYGYFLRAAAAIGRYDKAWLQAYLPFFDQLRADVATYDRQDSRYPLLRNFSPFYGHSWADGLANGGSGENHESSGEALSFAVGLIELGQLLGNTEWRDLGLYLYEEEVLALEQYWFNQDADLAQPSPTFYNGNWPESFVHFTLNGSARSNAIIGRIIQDQTTRSTFFDNAVTVSPPYANAYIIQMLPLSASHLHIGRDAAWLASAWSQFGVEAALAPGSTAYEVLVAGFQARLPAGGSGVSDPGPDGALARISQVHPIYPGAINAQGQHWAYSLAALGQIDASVVADTTSYGIFCQGGTGNGCQGGTRTYVAYNPSSLQETVTFRDRQTGSALASLNVPAGTMTTVAGNGAPYTDYLTPLSTDRSRLYLTKPANAPVNCVSDPTVYVLTALQGNWLPPSQAFPYPSDLSNIAPSLVCVPPKPTTTGDDQPPNPAFVRTWQGTFSGSLDKDQTTRFTLYVDQALVPGFQQGVCVSGGLDLPTSCPNYVAPGGVPSSKNNYIVQIRYDFDNDGQDDRVEQYRVVSPDTTNTFTQDGKMTEYRADVLAPFFGDAPMELRPVNGKPSAGFPALINAAQPARVAIDLWGFHNAQVGERGQFPVYVSVNADPLTNRASWIRPPYRALSTGPGLAKLSALISGKTGAQASRVWTVTLSNTGSGTALNAQITGLTLTQTYGPACAPVIAGAFPVSLGDIPLRNSANGTVSINFTGCAPVARFRADIAFGSNNGAVSGSSYLNNQFR